jgi:hypothetical protein
LTAQLQQAAQNARDLKLLGLLDSSEEITVLRVEIAWVEAQSPGRKGNWDREIELWSELADLYHKTPEIDAKLEAAKHAKEKMQLALERAEEARAAGKWERALKILNQLLRDDTFKEAVPLLDKQREVFEKGQQELLQVTNGGLDAGTNEGHLEAFKAVVELKRFEVLVSEPEENRESVPRLARLRPHLMAIEKNLVEDVDGFDNKLVNLRVNEALEMARELSANLVLLANNSEENHGQLNEKVQAMADRVTQLKEIMDLLEQGNGQEMWDSAVQQTHWTDLMLIREQLNGQDLPFLSMPEILAFGKQLITWKKACEILQKIIDQIETLFCADEKFGEAADKCGDKHHLPANLAADGLSADDWRVIRELKSEHLKFADIHVDDGLGDLCGWDQVEVAAKERGDQLEAWEKWAKRCEELYEEAQKSWEDASDSNSLGTLIERRDRWLQAQKHADNALKEMRLGGPSNNANPMPALSRKAKHRRSAVDDALPGVEEWAVKTGEQISGLDEQIEDPAPRLGRAASFSNQKNWPAVRKLVDEANRIGYVDDKEREKWKHYQKLAENPPQDRWLDHFVDSLADWFERFTGTG